jgi:hypothetical protein
MAGRNSAYYLRCSLDVFKNSQSYETAIISSSPQVSAACPAVSLKSRVKEPNARSFLRKNSRRGRRATTEAEEESTGFTVVDLS